MKTGYLPATQMGPRPAFVQVGRTGRRRRDTEGVLGSLKAKWPRTSVALLTFLAGLVRVQADQGWEGHSLHFNWENDATRGSDRHYTQGARIRYLSSDEAAPGWLRGLSKRMPALGFQDAALKYAVEVGQEMYTPENLRASEPLLKERPYAGWFYASAALQRRGSGPAGLPVLEHVRLDLGVIGPESYAEDTQKVWHGTDPRGWDHQLKTEVGFVLRYQRQYLYRIRNAAKWTADFIPEMEASLGSVAVHARAGALIQAGYNIPNRFEVPGEKTAKQWGAYCFLGGGGRVIGRNLFLDGNTWRSSQSVDKKYVVADGTVGLTLVGKSFEVTASQHFRTREFVGQTSADSYGSVTVTFKF
jgi:hypothetical protein